MLEKAIFRVFVLGQTRASTEVLENLEAICQEHCTEDYRIEVIDLRANMQIAEDEEIFATPTVERTAPEPVVRVVGDLSDRTSALRNLQIG